MSDKVLRTTGGKKIRTARTTVDPVKGYKVNEAVDAIKAANYVKFDQTIDLAINLGVDPKHSDQVVRGVVCLPCGTGKEVKVAVICKEERESEAKSSGADFVGAQEIIANIKDGKIPFDICVATPDMMGVIGQVAKILGPKGLMPNPKLGTVTTDIATAVKNAKSGQVEYRTEKAGIIHAGVGKMSFKTEDLVSNIQSLVSAVVKAKPSNVKGAYLKSVYLSSTMGPSVKLELSSVNV